MSHVKRHCREKLPLGDNVKTQMKEIAASAEDIRGPLDPTRLRETFRREREGAEKLVTVLGSHGRLPFFFG